MWVGERVVWVWRRFFRRQASAVRAFSLNEFDGYREIGNGSGGLCPRDFRGDLKFRSLRLARGDSVQGIAAERDRSR